MDKRLGRVNPDEARTERERFFSKVSSGEMTLGQGNPTVETINKIGAVFGLQVGFVPIRR